jgi:iron(III) transport system permease protein
MTTSNIVAASTLWNLWQFPDLPGAAALAMLLMTALLAVVVPSQLYVSSRLER